MEGDPIFDRMSTLDAAIDATVGAVCGISFEDRWQKETDGFAAAIAAHCSPEVKVVLDYGCGVGRISRALLNRLGHIRVAAIDASEAQRRFAAKFVDNQRFSVHAPESFGEPVDLACLLYVLQHAPAIDIRDILKRIHFWLRPGGLLLYCSSDYRMAIQFDQRAFFDDRFLGVSLRAEIERLFEPVAPLFPQETLSQHPVISQIVTGMTPEWTRGWDWIPHPAFVFRRREIKGPLYNVPPPRSLNL